jgi:hypothetical protein
MESLVDSKIYVHCFTWQESELKQALTKGCHPDQLWDREAIISLAAYLFDQQPSQTLTQEYYRVVASLFN